MSDLDMMSKLLLAALLGGAIGFERETHGRAAGLRTHILVCVGSALIMLISIYSSYVTKNIGPSDPSRIAAGVVTGLGFLGAGTIMRFGTSIKGLTTAASLWVTGGIGLAVGLGFYKSACFTTVLILVALILFAKLEKKLSEKGWFKKISDEVDKDI